MMICSCLASTHRPSSLYDISLQVNFITDHCMNDFSYIAITHSVEVTAMCLGTFLSLLLCNFVIKVYVKS